METYRCPRCNLPMDEGIVGFSESSAVYISNKQKGIFKRGALIRQARACPSCGYVEVYLDPNELKKNIS